MALATSSPAANLYPWSMAPLRAALPSVSSARIHSCSFSTPLRSLRTGSSAKRSLRCFTGLTPTVTIFRTFSETAPTAYTSSDKHSCLLSWASLLRDKENVRYEDGFIATNNGSKFFAMRHGKRVPKLNRPPDQRRALIRGLTTQLLKHGRIKTTRPRASALRKYVDKMITLAKDGSLHKRRQALGFIYEKQIVHALFAEVQDRYGERNGGYTRIIRTLPRRGDNAPMAYIELV
ncbi:hypothetical protein KSP40_PGU000239 [Platanthera guangdongensis]|uniref:50S ribosomal protein L17, chloroplastic n=1 Tax=Platanthera guangdongensis TaxID=2320717 RepID=A0ABR2M0L0_9ASPA